MRQTVRNIPLRTAGRKGRRLLTQVDEGVAEAGRLWTDVSLGGAEKDYCGPQASIVSIEREGDTTRFLIYDSVCDAPRVFGVPDGQPLRELPNDWKKMDPQGMEP